MDETVDRGRLSRHLVRAQGHAVLATSLADGSSARPYASLVAVACNLDATPLLLISDLAQHSRNIAADPRVSLLFDGGGPASGADPLAEPRVTLLGKAMRCDDAHCLARLVARHPSAAQYAGFGDFRLYRVEIERGHLVAGFGRIAWIERDELRLAGDPDELAAAEPDIVTDMNAHHTKAMSLFATQMLGRPAGDWRMTGIDPEGLDLRCGEMSARLDFSAPAPPMDSEEVQRRLIALVAGAIAATKIVPLA